MSVKFHIKIARRVRFYMYNMIIPSAMVAFLSSFAFFLPPSSGERVSLVITTLLALGVYVLMIAESVPPNSDVVPLLVR